MKFIYYLIFFLLVSALFAAIEGTLFHIRPCCLYRCSMAWNIAGDIVHRNIAGSFTGKKWKGDSEDRKGVLSFFLRLCGRNHQIVFHVEKSRWWSVWLLADWMRCGKHWEEKIKKCCFLYLGHYCNWEYVASLQYWFPEIHCGQIYHPLYNKAFDKLFLRLRGQFGGESIPMKETLRRLVTLSRGEKKVMIGFISDQAPGWEGMSHWTKFF